MILVTVRSSEASSLYLLGVRRQDRVLIGGRNRTSHIQPCTSNRGFCADPGGWRGHRRKRGGRLGGRADRVGACRIGHLFESPRRVGKALASVRVVVHRGVSYTQ